MPTIITHAVVPLAIGLGLGRGLVPWPLLVAGVVAAVLPDADVLAFRLGIPYANEFGHRGFSHSLVFAALVGLAALAGSRVLRSNRFWAFAFVFLSAASHGLLDTLTTGGLGVALLWPFSEARFFAPWHVIRVSPIGVGRLVSARGVAILISELKWVWGPAVVVGILLAVGVRRWRLDDEVTARSVCKSDPD